MTAIVHKPTVQEQRSDSVRFLRAFCVPTSRRAWLFMAPPVLEGTNPLQRNNRLMGAPSQLIS